MLFVEERHLVQRPRRNWRLSWPSPNYTWDLFRIGARTWAFCWMDHWRLICNSSRTEVFSLVTTMNYEWRVDMVFPVTCKLCIVSTLLNQEKYQFWRSEVIWPRRPTEAVSSLRQTTATSTTSHYEFFHSHLGQYKKGVGRCPVDPLLRLLSNEAADDQHFRELQLGVPLVQSCLYSYRKK